MVSPPCAIELLYASPEYANTTASPSVWILPEWNVKMS